jgi:hypothetical protein
MKTTFPAQGISGKEICGMLYLDGLGATYQRYLRCFCHHDVCCIGHNVPAFGAWSRRACVIYFLSFVGAKKNFTRELI